MNQSLLRILTVAVISIGGIGCREANQPLHINETTSCPTWYHHKNASISNQCECGVEVGRQIICAPNESVVIALMICMTYNNASLTTEAGVCPFTIREYMEDFYKKPPKDVKKLNEFACGELKRKGRLCSHCEEPYGVAVLSYKYECTHCLGVFYGWLLYFTLTLIPITLFYLIIVFCNIRVNSAFMNSTICIIQLLAYNFNTTPVAISKQERYPSKVIFTLAGIWNLDFFRYVYLPFCISANYSTLHVIAFEYIIAFYPLVLIVLTYISIELYDRDYTLLQYMWKPFKWCLGLWSFFRKSRNENTKTAKENMISVFVTFNILAYSKILYITLLSTTKITKGDGTVHLLRKNDKEPYFLQYNASIQYNNSTEHLPFLVLAISVLVLFNILPMILLFIYPTKLYTGKKIKFPDEVQLKQICSFIDESCK